jgi:hypothetical protein
VEEYLLSAALTFAAIESSRSGKPVHVPSFLEQARHTS